MVEYWVYDHWGTGGEDDLTATIHTSLCHFVKNRKIKQVYGAWRGPFKTYGEAYNVALDTHKEVRNCSFCKPRAH